MKGHHCLVYLWKNCSHESCAQGPTGGASKSHFIHVARINADNADNFHAPYNDDWLHDDEDEERIIGKLMVFSSVGDLGFFGADPPYPYL